MTFRILEFKTRTWKTMGRGNEGPRTGIYDTYFGEGNLSNVNYSAPPFSETGQSRPSASQTSNNQVDYINTDRRNADPTSMGGGKYVWSNRMAVDIASGSIQRLTARTWKRRKMNGMNTAVDSYHSASARESYTRSE